MGCPVQVSADVFSGNWSIRPPSNAFGVDVAATAR
jgi:hypothetical protein